jgi:flagellar biosynthetic protein FliP
MHFSLLPAGDPGRGVHPPADHARDAADPRRSPRPARRARRAAALVAAAVATVLLGLGAGLATGVATASPAAAQAAPAGNPIVVPEAPTPPDATAPPAPEMTPPTTVAGNQASTLDINLNTGDKPSKSIVIILMLTVLSVAPSLVIMLTPFTRLVVVFSLARNAMGVHAVPPNQVLVGLAMFLSFFIMGPTLKQMNEVGLQPLLNEQKTESQAFNDALVPLRAYMLKNTRKEELALFVNQAQINGEAPPATPEDVDMTALVPAYILSELQSAFIIGFVIFIPFLIIDLVVSAVLMSLGMMMLPPVVVSLPFKILLFVMVGGWTLIVETLIRSFH